MGHLPQCTFAWLSQMLALAALHLVRKVHRGKAARESGLKRETVICSLRTTWNQHGGKGHPHLSHSSLCSLYVAALPRDTEGLRLEADDGNPREQTSDGNEITGRLRPQQTHLQISPSNQLLGLDGGRGDAENP